MDYRTFRHMIKQGAAVMTPEAEQAAMQPPMDPSMQGGMPPMDPAMAGGMPPADPSMQGDMAPQGPQGGQLPPEIVQDQAFLQYLMQMAGIVFDPQSGMFMGPDGQPVPAEIIMQAYQEYQAQMQQGGDPSMMGGQPPMDPAMAGGMPPSDPAMGGDPAAMGEMPPEQPPMEQPPMDPAMTGGQPPMEQPPMDPAMGAMPPEGEQPPAVPDEVMDQIVSAVMSGVEAMMQQYTEKIETKFAELSDKLDAMVEVTAGTDDMRTKDDRDQISKLRQEMENDLTPVKQASAKPQEKKASRKLVNIFDIIQG